MTGNELLLAISDMIDKKLKPIHDNLTEIKITQENDILPRLQNVESCYTSTYKRYANGIEHLEAIMQDIEILKKVVTEHSIKLQQIS